MFNSGNQLNIYENTSFFKVVNFKDDWYLWFTFTHINKCAVVKLILTLTPRVLINTEMPLNSYLLQLHLIYTTFKVDCLTKIALFFIIRFLSFVIESYKHKMLIRHFFRCTRKMHTLFFSTVVECQFNPCENFQCADQDLPVSGPECT